MASALHVQGTYWTPVVISRHSCGEIRLWPLEPACPLRNLSLSTGGEGEEQGWRPGGEPNALLTPGISFIIWPLCASSLADLSDH
ncbi:hypothetical protein SKAU_G00219840 [Synaphobranchus kaupii]|uniref:Uncharacterized protein n=1 Tax=Synaphobranchus kaupii TaxID=118154 RepID=A0A9Q1FAR5_SYNKA|nr:hypothetical protein SKAU_G00219840 [Synaphobranchus kaupii]